MIFVSYLKELSGFLYIRIRPDYPYSFDLNRGDTETHRGNTEMHRGDTETHREDTETHRKGHRKAKLLKSWDTHTDGQTDRWTKVHKEVVPTQKWTQN